VQEEAPVLEEVAPQKRSLFKRLDNALSALSYQRLYASNFCWAFFSMTLLHSRYA
jgi:hypothetical protein